MPNQCVNWNKSGRDEFWCDTIQGRKYQVSFDRTNDKWASVALSSEFMGSFEDFDTAREAMLKDIRDNNDALEIVE